MLRLSVHDVHHTDIAPAERWDSVSKQPRFKAGVVRLEKLSSEGDNDGVFCRSQRAEALPRAEEKQNAEDVADKSERKRYLGIWLGETIESMKMLEEVFQKVKEGFSSDFELVAGLNVLSSIAQHAHDALAPIGEKYKASTSAVESTSSFLRDSISSICQESKGFAKLLALHRLSLFLGNIEGEVTALLPTSQALWDANFHQAINQVTEDIGRIKAWVLHMVKVRSPQTLIVPS